MLSLEVTAHHEAGHAIAVKLRKGTVRAVTLDPGETTYYLPSDRRSVFHHGQLVDNPIYGQIGEPDAFVPFAGCWASARAKFIAASRAGRESFTTFVASELMRNPLDHHAYEAVELPGGVEERWHAELLDNWPLIASEARILLRVHREEFYWRKARIESERSKKFRAIRKRSRQGQAPSQISSN